MRRSRKALASAGLVIAAGLWLAALLLPQDPEPARGGAGAVAAGAATRDASPASSVVPPPSATIATEPDSSSASAEAARSAAVPAVKVDPLLQAPIPPREGLRRLVDCAFLADPEQPARLESRWAWLSPELAALERDWQAQAKRAVANHCADWAVDANTPRFRSLQQALRDRLTRSPDPLDRVLAALLAEQHAEEALPAIRAEIEDLVRRGRGQEIVAMADVLWMSPWWSPSTAGAYAGGHSSALWQLVACDLGADCGARSSYLQRACARSGYCGYPDVETLMHDAVLGQDAAERVAAARAALLERIRSGQVEGLFDPVPLPPTGP